MNTHTPDAQPTPTPGRRPSHRGALAIGAAATLLMVTLLVVALTDPGGGDHPDDGATGPNAGVGAPMIGHIHGIVPDPEGDQTDHGVLIGAHYGLFSVDADGNVAQVGDDVTDYMALTAAGPGRLLASGHPEPTDESRPMNLGLIESRDGGRQWTTLSLDGAADFHALEHAPGEPGRTWGIDSVTGGLVTSTDERAWTTVHEQPLVDIALDPGDPARVLATTGDGRLLEVTADRNGERGAVDEGGSSRRHGSGSSTGRPPTSWSASAPTGRSPDRTTVGEPGSSSPGFPATRARWASSATRGSRRPATACSAGPWTLTRRART